ncbi:MAG: DUF2235 domain-containing protein, partial [Gemmatimonadota bacterium]|nr:DUF2235 domain-containing protein [Gemmatimonadota bacterium]
VWDTVGALGIPVETPVTSPIRSFNEATAGFHDVTLSAYVDYAFHALALDEQREAFKPTLWVQQPHAKAAGQVLEQVWFTGVHSDVGGGYAASERGLANVTLRWMVNRVTDTCGLEVDLRPLAKREGQKCTFKVHDSMGLLYKAGNMVGVSKPFRRIVDGGLCPDGVRDAEQVVTEALHGSAERFATEASTGGAFDPVNVRDYLERRINARAPTPPSAKRDRRRAAVTVDDVDEVTLERLDGAGAVVSALTIDRVGHVRYSGSASARRPGTFAGTARRVDFSEVARSIVDSAFFGLADQYASTATRGSATSVTVVSGRRRKSVVSYDRFGPERLKDVERVIDAVERHADWTVT